MTALNGPAFDRIPEVRAVILGLTIAAVALAALSCVGKDATSSASAGGRTPSGSDHSLEASVAKRISVAQDMTVFTLFCLLNAAGYDLENRGAMHPVRTRVRTELETRVPRDLRDRIRAYYRAHADGADPWSYSVAAKATSGPPDFTPTSDWAEIRAGKPFSGLGDLHVLLRELYVRADVPALYARVEGPYRDYARDYEAVIRREVAAVLSYCRVADVGALSAAPPHEQPNALVIPNLLDSYEHAFSFVLADRFISVEGPQVQAGYNPHEFVHAVTNPAVYGEATRARESALKPLAEEGARALGDDGMTSVEAFVDECLVRAVSLRYLTAANPERLEALSATMMQEYRSGYVLERFFWEELARYEEAEGVELRRFYPGMLARLDPAAELVRFRASGRP